MKSPRLEFFLRYWLPPILWFGLISAFSTSLFAASLTLGWFERILHLLMPSISRATVLLIHTSCRKAAHFAEFFVLALLFYRAFRQDRPFTWRWSWGIPAWGLSVALSLLDEFHQLFVPHRSGSLRDALLDLVGALTAVLLLSVRARLAGARSGPLPDHSLTQENRPAPTQRDRADQ